ncbi:hypothetical protein AVEN_88387-2 [Araneus ventricosus]|uniref:Uncharacterized protein n=1 Tax=Araneus ventricosus TaxID=182803 RepID=A0A4Y2GH61_ARAVE|nr:hypothetical protein AVEN_88387-2 [Araneus ventricosus]
MVSSLKIMKQYLEELSVCLTNDTITNFAALLKRLPGHLFSSLKKSIEMFDISQDMTSIFLGVPLPETLTVPVSEAICETWDSVIDLVNKRRLRSADGNEDDIGTNNKRNFIKIDSPPSGYKNTRKCLKAELT